MRSIQIFCRRTSHNLNAGAIIVFVFSLAFVGLSKDIFAKDISSKFTASDADQEINIAIVDPSGKPIRQIKTPVVFI